MNISILTIGLFDKNTCKQEITSDAARAILDKILLQDFGLYAYTMLECNGVYTMNDGRIVHEPSIRVEIVTDSAIDDLPGMIQAIKTALNQECIMVQTMQSNINFM